VRQLIAAQAACVCLVRDWVPQAEIWRSRAEQHVHIVQGDVGDRSLMERILGEYEIQTVFHLAAQTIVGVALRNPISTFETNIRGTWTLLEACRRSPRVEQIVVASSDKAYGVQDELPYHENTPLAAVHPYDMSKSCADMIARSYAVSYNLPVVVTRCGNFFGGGDLNWNRIVPGTIRAVLRGERPVLRSDGSPVRDYFYVEDGAAAYQLLAEQLAVRPALRGEAFNFSNQQPLSVNEMVFKILELMECDLVPLVCGDATQEISEQSLSAAKARRMLGWAPRFGLEDALHRTIDWYRDFFRSARANPAPYRPHFHVSTAPFRTAAATSGRDMTNDP
jgi:CDP-glucose 4,6-dehydratase